MKIFSTFNDKIYHSSGRDLIFSLKGAGMIDSFIGYYEFSDKENVKTLLKLAPNSRNLNSSICGEIITNIFNKNKHIIPQKHGGTAPQEICDDFWNRRWFSWFKKIAMAYDALWREDADAGEIYLFLDSDIRVIKPFNQLQLKKLMNGADIGILKGNREAVEAGVIAVDARMLMASNFYEKLLRLFSSGAFQNMKRWDDGYVFAKLMKGEGLCKFHDFAKEKKQKKFTNSNGHETNNQILPFSELGEFFEHDKGKHVRESII